MKRFGLIGYPLTHSFSKKYFEEKFLYEKVSHCSYELLELRNIDELLRLIESTSDLCGLNVTIPYKDSVMRFLHETDEIALQVGAVNCITIRNGKLKGYNTDVFGFEVSFLNFMRSKPRHVFVLGTGGSSKAVQFVLNKLAIPFQVVSRNDKLNAIPYSAMPNFMESPNLFINTTPLGMYPDTDTCPDIPYNFLTPHDMLFDLIYNPLETEFLKRGREAGCKIKNGLEMLQLQAEKSWEIWNAQ